MTPARRTDFVAFVLDLLDFIEEKIGEAMETDTSRVAAIGEAAGVLPLLRERLRENEVVQANFILLLEVMFEERYAAGRTRRGRFSGRYPDEEILAEATKIFPNSRVAADLDRLVV
jgi:hypothetical protein